MDKIHDLLDEFRKSLNMTFYVKCFVDNPKYIKEIVEIIKRQEKHPFPEYGSWILTHIVKQNADLIEPFKNELIDVILIKQNQSVLRNVVVVLRDLGISEYKETELLDRYISFIKENSNKVALQVNAMYCLIDYVKKYPELKDEITSIIQLAAVEKSPAYTAGFKNFLKRIKKI